MKVNRHSSSSQNSPLGAGGNSDELRGQLMLMEMRSPSGDTCISAMGMGGWREVELTIIPGHAKR